MTLFYLYFLAGFVCLAFLDPDDFRQTIAFLIATILWPFIVVWRRVLIHRTKHLDASFRQLVRDIESAGRDGTGQL